MEQYLTFIVGVVAVLGLPREVLSFPAEELRETQEIWPIPRMNGGVKWMTEEEATAEADAEVFRTTETFDEVKFFLYTEESPTKPVEIVKGDLKSLKSSKYNPEHPTRFMIHGWNGGYTAGWSIREALLINGTNRKYNFISVDWSVYSTSLLYISSQKSCSKAGKIVAEFIDWLHDEAKISFETLAIYGHSLGAHVAGFTGKNVKSGKVQTIVGLDPAMPLFRFKQPKKRLADTDAVYVETIQTNGGILGFYNPIGKAAFYPNGGKGQPGCEGDFFCAHGRSVEYFAEALSQEKKNGFVALECSDLDSMEKASCGRKLPLVRLGDPNNVNKAKGIYFLKTNSQAPYGIVKF